MFYAVSMQKALFFGGLIGIDWESTGSLGNANHFKRLPLIDLQYLPWIIKMILKFLNRLVCYDHTREVTGSSPVSPIASSFLISTYDLLYNYL